MAQLADLPDTPAPPVPELRGNDIKKQIEILDRHLRNLVVYIQQELHEIHADLNHIHTLLP